MPCHNSIVCDHVVPCMVTASCTRIMSLYMQESIVNLMMVYQVQVVLFVIAESVVPEIPPVYCPTCVLLG